MPSNSPCNAGHSVLFTTAAAMLSDLAAQDKEILTMHPRHPMLPFAIPGDWNPQQAMAVIDFLDELRRHIWQRYQIALHEIYGELYGDSSGTNQNRPPAPFDDPIDF